MKLGLIADIHADAPTLRRALSLLDALGAAQVLCAGDLVDYGCCPDETINLLRARDIPCVCGNHDREAFTRKPSRRKPYHTDPARLAPESRAYLRALPFDYKARFNGRCVALYHAAPTTDLELVHPEVMPGGALDALFDEAGADVLVLGHTHIPLHVETPRGVVINPGSLLARHETRLPSSRTFGLLDIEALDYQLFDVESGLPYAATSWGWKPTKWPLRRPLRGAPRRG
ncbi:MAG: hypothetical protein Kow00120_28870 [Anaerolineae bacterium]